MNSDDKPSSEFKILSSPILHDIKQLNDLVSTWMRERKNEYNYVLRVHPYVFTLSLFKSLLIQEDYSKSDIQNLISDYKDKFQQCVFILIEYDIDSDPDKCIDPKELVLLVCKENKNLTELVISNKFVLFLIYRPKPPDTVVDL